MLPIVFIKYAKLRLPLQIKTDTALTCCFYVFWSVYVGWNFGVRPFFYLSIGNMDFKVVRAGAESKFFELCQGVVEQLGLGLYDLTYAAGAKRLTIFIFDKETKTARLEDCAKVDHALTDVFEQAEWIPESITVEVSSPGIYRQLKNKTHFDMAVGEQIKVEFNNNGDVNGVNGALIKKRKVVATLVRVNEEQIEIEFEKKKYNLAFEIIKKANLEATI